MTDQHRAETEARRDIVLAGRSLFDRRLTHGRTGNVSVRIGDTVLTTPTGVGLGRLTEDGLSALRLDGTAISGPGATKEAFLHLAFYRARPSATAVVHLHSTYATAVSCLDGIDADDVLPPLTAYYAMRVGTLPLLPYHAPGDPSLGPLAQERAAGNHALLLANHGPIVAAGSIAGATDAVEELEETAKLYLLLRNEKTRPLSEEEKRVLAG